MPAVVRVVIVALALVAWGPCADAGDPALFRLFLLNGDTVTSYGEYARLDDRVVFSMPVGGRASDPRLQVVSLPAGLIDWARTERHAESARYQRYVATRGEADYERVADEVARVLSRIAVTTDPREALSIAEHARRTLADWPRTHYGYRQDDVREIIGILDNAIGALRGTTGTSSFQLALVATAAPVPVEPLAPMPDAREQLDQLLRVVSMTTQPGERIALLQSAVALMHESRGALTGLDVPALRRSAEDAIRLEQSIDGRYAQLSRRLAAAARRHAASGRVVETQKVLDEVRRQDARMGRLRPEMILALETTVVAQIEAAKTLRLLRDRWMLRQSLYADYQRSVGSQMVQLVKARPQLEAIRRLDGPEPKSLQALRTRLAGGAERLARVPVPEDMGGAHDLLVTAWRFADNAVRVRFDAVASGNIDTAREASSAAAGALLMFNRAQQEIRTYLEPPRLP